MLRSLRLRNFRAFRNQQFDFSRINIFVGKNSSGKSSAISAINFLAQSINTQAELATPIVFNGPFEQLGTYVDIVHGNHVLTPIEFDFTFGGEQRHRINFAIKYRAQRRETEISSFAYYQNEAPLYEYYIGRKDAYDIRAQGQWFEQLLPGVQKARPIFTSIFPFDRNIMRFLPSFAEERDAERFGAEKIAFLRGLESRIRRGRNEFSRLFRSFDSLSPFRDPPQRTYLFTGEAPSSVGKTGSNGIAMLANDFSRRGSAKKGIIDEITQWLQVTNIARAIELNALTQRHFELCLVDLDGKRHNICDVGFGCSQVLPVLVGALNAFSVHRQRAGSTPIFVVQEPEIHLNPSAQAALGSFFVGLGRFNGQLFIETHSDHLILRVARHIALGHLDPTDVAIFFCENNDGVKTAKRIELSELAVFKPEWPGGFFPQRETEAMGIARARMNRPKSSVAGQLDFFYPEANR